MNKDELRGKARNVRGRVKEAAGVLADNKDLEREGEAEQISGKVEESFGRLRRKAGEAIEELGRDVKR